MARIAHQRRCSRPLATALASLTALIVLAGCGKSALPMQGTREGGGGASAPVTTLGPAGAGGLSTANTTRLGGAGTIADAAAVARAVFPGLTASGRPQAVVLADVHDWPAALAASALAGAPLHAPILYSDKGTLPAATTQALAAMHPTGAASLRDDPQVIVVGGDVPRPAGYRVLALTASSPYALAAQVATVIGGLHGGRLDAAVIAGIAGPRALSMPAAGLAAQSGAPILLVGTGAPPAATLAALTRMHVRSAYAVGPPAAVAAATLKALDARVAATRIGGGTAVQNAISVAAYSNGAFGWGVQEPGHGLVFARSSRPFDAPAAALLSASADYGPLLLLAAAEGVPRPLGNYLRDIQPGYTSAPESSPVRGVYNRGWLIGDQAAISVKTQSELDALLRSVAREGAYAQPPRLAP